MSAHYEKHAEEVASAFLELLEAGVKEQITQDHRNELAMLVEAAISTAVFEQLEKASDQIQALSRELRDYAEHYDKN